MHYIACKQPFVTASYPFMGVVMGENDGLW